MKNLQKRGDLMANEMRDRLVELMLDKSIFDKQVCDLCTKDDYCERCGAECIADHLIANGVVVPPYKIGSMVWVIDSETSNDKNFYIFIDTITHYRIVDGCTIMCLDKHLGVADWNWDKVFLTKSEAEQKLKEMRGE